MEGETIFSSYSSESRKSFDTITILVVDDDLACLSIVAAILKKFKYEVVTVKHPNDALCTLRIKGDAFNLVVSDVHMPDMNGFELQQAIAQEFHLPVVLMSADNKEGVVTKGLESGAAFFISKPVSPDDLRNLWQFAAMKKKSEVVIKEIHDNHFHEEITSFDKNNSSEMPAVSASTLSGNKDLKRKSQGFDAKRGNSSQSASSKKPKVIWTNALHNRFLEAIRSIGLDRSVPTKILEVMNVPGLTRENVASHLQKYRIFLRRVSDASCRIHGVHDKGLSRRSISTFSGSSGTTPTSILMLNRFSKPHYQNPGNFRPGFKSQSRLGQSQIISGEGSLPKPDITSADLFNSDGRPGTRLAQQNSYETSPLFQGRLSNLSGANFDASVPGSTWVNSSISPEFSNLIPSKDFPHQMNYVGYKISNIKHLAESGSSKEYEDLNTCNGTVNFQHNELQNNSVDVAALPNDNINLEQLVQHFVSSSTSSYACDDNDGKQLSDNVQNLLLPSDLPFLGNLENERQIHESAFSPIYHLPEFDFITATQQPLEEGDLNNTFADEVNFQNQAQTNGGENIANSSFYGSTNHCDNQRDDDDFLASILAFGPFGADQILDGM